MPGRNNQPISNFEASVSSLPKSNSRLVFLSDSAVLTPEQVLNSIIICDNAPLTDVTFTLPSYSEIADYLGDNLTPGFMSRFVISCKEASFYIHTENNENNDNSREYVSGTVAAISYFTVNNDLEVQFLRA